MTIEMILRSARFRWTCEKDLQDGIAQLLPAASREHALSSSDIIDFFVDGVGIEVKVAGAAAAVLRQLTRYAKHSEVTSLILVTSRTQLLHQLPNVVYGKPLSIIALTGSVF